MWKRKVAAKPPTRKWMYKLDMVFSCPFYNHGSSVECRMRLRRVGWTAVVAELLHGPLQFQGDRASKVRRRYRRTEGRERRKGRGVPALTVNLRLHRVRHRREPTGRQRQLGAAGARPFGSQAKGYAYWIVIAASPMLAAPCECPASASPSCNPASTPRTGAAPPHRRAIAPPFPARAAEI